MNEILTSLFDLQCLPKCVIAKKKLSFRQNFIALMVNFISINRQTILVLVSSVSSPNFQGLYYCFQLAETKFFLSVALLVGGTAFGKIIGRNFTDLWCATLFMEPRAMT